ncbi:hypothetical protein [Janibacter sp. LM]|uniref:Uncharacterized protein n=1 Tax=Terrabacter sp. (strain DBF63) TaxID=150395 RepID=Q3MNJ9_TERSD|nr:hypothetical protein [Terrabacter sp. DBF63]
MKNSEAVRRHFHVPAREMLLEDPQRCPWLPGLTMVGVAVTDDEQHHVILELGTRSVDRFYLGPTQDDVTRRAQVLAHALRQWPRMSTPHASLIQDWVLMTWDSLLDELVAALTGRA